MPLPVCRYEKRAVSAEFLRIAETVIKKAAASEVREIGLYEKSRRVGLETKN